MNAYKKLLIEYQGIYDTLKDYSSGSTAIHIMPELKTALDINLKIGRRKD